MKKEKNPDLKVVARNRRSRMKFSVLEAFEAGIALQGWEVKSIREGRVQMKEGYVMLKNGEAWLHNALITPLLSASTHIIPESKRDRKLLLHGFQLERMAAAIDRKCLLALALFVFKWIRQRAIRAIVGCVNDDCSLA